jgi:hypothetical protein
VGTHAGITVAKGCGNLIIIGTGDALDLGGECDAQAVQG